MAANLAPVDDRVIIPDSVKRAAARAEAYYQPDPNTQPAPDPNTPPVETPPVAADQNQPPPTAPPVVPPVVPPVAADQNQPPPPVPPVQPAPDLKPEVTEESWQHRFHSMRGRYDQSLQTIGVMQEQMREMGDEMMRMQNVLAGQNASTPQNQPQTKQYLTPEDQQNYGTELLDTVKRAALEAVEPELSAVKNENTQLKQQITKQNRQGVFASLATAVPNWKTINTSPRFISWLRSPDVYSGQVRKALLNEAFQAANAPRVISFFKGFIDDEVATGQMSPELPTPQPQPPAPRQAAVSLASLAAPGRAKPATGDTQVPVDKPVFTRAQISKFYSDVRKGVYTGREQDKAVEEARIFAAQNDGRVR